MEFSPEENKVDSKAENTTTLELQPSSPSSPRPSFVEGIRETVKSSYVNNTFPSEEPDALLPPFPTLGVKLQVFSKFVEENNSSKVAGPLTTTDMCMKFLKPLTQTKQQSYCEYLVEQNSPDVGEATVFISHAWKYTFEDVVDALQHHFADEPDIYI